VEEVIAADRDTIPIAADRDHLQRRRRQLRAGRNRECAPVQRVEAVGFDIARKARRAANARYDDRVVRLDLQLGERAIERVEHTEVAAAGTPHRLQIRLVAEWRVAVHAVTSESAKRFTCSITSPTRNARPPDRA